MLTDFFKKSCQTITNQQVFGLCDDEDLLDIKTPAYLDFENTDNWLAKVTNTSPPKNITFTAIDHCVFIYDKLIDNPKKCDVMLTFDDSIIFIELKNKFKNPAQIAQLENTIELFCKNNSINNYSKKQAYLANKKKTVFITQDRKEKFSEKNNGFRLFFSVHINLE